MRSFTRVRACVLVLLVLASTIFVYSKVYADPLGDLKKELGRAYQAEDWDGAAGVIARIGALDTAVAAEFLVDASFLHQSAAVYEAARAAIGNMRSAEARTWIFKNARTGKPPIRIGLYEVLAGWAEDSEAEKVLIEGLAEKRIPQILSTCARALAKQKSKAAVTPLIDALVEAEKTKDVLWVDILTALNDITGMSYETAEHWRNFWKVAERTFDPNKDRGNEDIGNTIARGAPTFFSEKVLSKRVLFIIDVSGSMRAEDPPSDKGPGGKRIDKAKNQLEATIRQIDENAYFNCIAFDDRIRTWQKVLQRAQGGTKAKAIVWVQGLQEMGMTHTDEALDEAFKDENINTIYLLTDGQPMKMDPRTMDQLPVDPQKILERVATLNRFRKIKIFTMGFEAVGKEPDGEVFVKFLKDLAEQNGGKFIPIN